MRTQYFREFLYYFWLRPENALLLAIRAEEYRKTLEYFGDGSNTIDVSCGDGVFSFITFGGKLSKDSDMFRSVKTLKTFRDEKYDAFDSFDENYFIKVIKHPAIFYEYGTDWKLNLLKKADKLKAYKYLILHDNNYKFNFQDNTMTYVYSNSAYWVQNFYFHIKDLIRITKPKGHIVLEMKTKSILNYKSDKYLPFMGTKFHSIIDAGRLATWKGLLLVEELKEFFQSLKDVITVVDFKPIYGGDLLKIWDIGLRPLFNPLVKMANNLNEKNRLEIKEEWCMIFYELFEEYISNYKVNEDEAAEYLIVLEKNR